MKRDDGDESSDFLDQEAIDTLRELIPLLDEIFTAEYDPDHASIQRYTGSQIPVCDFCAADIFQSFFECRYCANTDGAYQLCACCYVEGRNCICRGLQPVQRFSLDTLLDQRNQAAALVSWGPLTKT